MSDETYRAAVSESEFERMMNSDRIVVTDYSGMGQMSEFDRFVAFHVGRTVAADRTEVR